MRGAIVILIAVGVFAGCDRNYDGGNDEDTVYLPPPQSQTIIPEAEWESFKRETNLVIDANQAKLRELRNTASAKHAAKVAELDEENETLRRELRQFMYESEERWLAFRDGFSQDMNALTGAIDGVYGKNGK